MMNVNVNVNSAVDIRNVGTQALVAALGPVGYARFLQQFSNGSGDYTKEKYLAPEPSMEELVAELMQDPDE